MAIDYAWKSDVREAYAQSATTDAELKKKLALYENITSTLTSLADIGVDVYEQKVEKKDLELIYIMIIFLVVVLLMVNGK